VKIESFFSFLFFLTVAWPVVEPFTIPRIKNGGLSAAIFPGMSS